MGSTFKPFADDAASIGIGGLTAENGTDRIALYGQMDITRDHAGLEQARAIRKLLDGIVKALEGDKNLPERMAPPDEPDEVRNPFS